MYSFVPWQAHLALAIALELHMIALASIYYKTVLSICRLGHWRIDKWLFVVTAAVHGG